MDDLSPDHRRARVEHDVKIAGEISGLERQIDVLAESAIVGETSSSASFSTLARRAASSMDSAD